MPKRRSKLLRRISPTNLLVGLVLLFLFSNSSISLYRTYSRSTAAAPKSRQVQLSPEVVAVLNRPLDEFSDRRVDDPGSGQAEVVASPKERKQQQQKKKERKDATYTAKPNRITELQNSLFGSDKRDPKPGLARGAATAAAAGQVDDEDEAPLQEVCEEATCGSHGSCSADRTRCECLCTHKGNKCQKLKDLPVRVVKNKSFHFFQGHVTLNKQSVSKGSNLEVFLHDKVGQKLSNGKVSKGRVSLGQVDQELWDALPEKEVLRRNHFYESCAIVGSSGIVHHYPQHGREIDEHDLVVRFNGAPTRHFEKLVGKRTDWRITNAQNWAFREHENANETGIVHMRSAVSLEAYRRTLLIHPETNLVALHPAFVEHMSNLGFMPTSGLYGVVLAMLNCKQVSLYGFQVSRNHGVLYHYYNKCDRAANQRRDSIEWYAVKALVDAGVASFIEDCILECHINPSSCTKCKKESKVYKERVGYGAAERESCPRCSSQPGGCRPGQGEKPGMHWAFSPNWKKLAKRPRNHGSARSEDQKAREPFPLAPPKPKDITIISSPSPSTSPPPPPPSPPPPSPPPPSPPPPPPPPPRQKLVRQIDPNYNPPVPSAPVPSVSVLSEEQSTAPLATPTPQSIIEGSSIVGVA